MTGKYGPYCGEKCGFRLGKIFGEELTDEEAKSLISGEDVYLSRISKNSGNAYGIIVKLSDIREYPFTRKDGSIGSYFYPDVAFRFPDREEERKRTSEKRGSICHRSGVFDGGRSGRDAVLKEELTYMV